MYGVAGTSDGFLRLITKFSVPYSGKFSSVLIFVAFVDDRSTVKLNPRNKLDCTVHNGCECTHLAAKIKSIKVC